MTVTFVRAGSPTVS